ncbi:MAG: hypothetical protein PVJ39_11205 [Gammaproteobacteria bacterium]|jgi:hypothetical protein
MAFPLGSVLSAAPGVISAAADIIRAIRENKSRQSPDTQPDPAAEKLAELNSLIERQAQVIEELAQNNSNLALAVRNNRILAGIALGAAGVAIIVAL